MRAILTCWLLVVFSLPCVAIMQTNGCDKLPGMVAEGWQRIWMSGKVPFHPGPYVTNAESPDGRPSALLISRSKFAQGWGEGAVGVNLPAPSMTNRRQFVTIPFLLKYRHETKLNMAMWFRDALWGGRSPWELRFNRGEVRVRHSHVTKVRDDLVARFERGHWYRLAIDLPLGGDGGSNAVIRVDRLLQNGDWEKGRGFEFVSGPYRRYRPGLAVNSTVFSDFDLYLGTIESVCHD